MNKQQAKQYVQDRVKDSSIDTLTVQQKVALINQLIQELRQNNFVTIVDDSARYIVKGITVDDSGMTYLV